MIKPAPLFRWNEGISGMTVEVHLFSWMEEIPGTITQAFPFPWKNGFEELLIIWLDSRSDYLSSSFLPEWTDSKNEYASSSLFLDWRDYRNDYDMFSPFLGEKELQWIPGMIVPVLPFFWNKLDTKNFLHHLFPFPRMKWFLESLHNSSVYWYE